MIGAEYIIFGIIYGQDLQRPQDPQTAYKEKLPQGSIYINPKNSSHGEEKTRQGRKHHERI